MWHRLLLVAALLLIGGQPQAQGSGQAASAQSVLEIPLELDLGGLMGKAEALLPREVGHWRGWRKEHGVETRYRAWRGPLSLRLQGGVLMVQAHVRYWVRARKRLIGSFAVDAGCGVDEPPRQAVVGTEVRIGWGPDWTLQPRFRILPTRFIDRCEVTALGIDVSPLIGRLFRQRMESSLREAMLVLRPRLEAARAQALRYWQSLQPPRELTAGVWFKANPLAVGLAPPWGSGQHLQTVLGLVLAPQISMGDPGGAVQGLLPPMQTFYPRGRGMRFDLALDLNLTDLGAHLSRELAGKRLSVEGREIGVGSVELSGEGAQLQVTAELTGDAAGRIQIWAEPRFDTESQTMRLNGLDFVYDADDPDNGLLANLFYQRIQAALEEDANALLASQTSNLGDALRGTLAAALPLDLELDLSRLRIARLDLTLRASKLSLSGAASGMVSVKTR